MFELGIWINCSSQVSEALVCVPSSGGCCALRSGQGGETLDPRCQEKLASLFWLLPFPKLLLQTCEHPSPCPWPTVAHGPCPAGGLQLQDSVAPGQSSAGSFCLPKYKRQILGPHCSGGVTCM